MKRGFAFLTLLALTALPLAAPAEGASHEEEAPPQPIIWLSYLDAQSGTQELIQYIVEENSGLYRQLMDDGKIYEWGLAQPITHRGGDSGRLAEWVTFADWAAADDFVRRFMAQQGAKSPEDMAASREAYMEVVVPGSHADSVLQSVHTASNGQRPGYIVIGYQKAMPGKEMALNGMWMEQIEPMMKKLMADGDVQGYGLFTQALHGDSGWTHGSWATVSGLGGIDTLNKAYSTLGSEVMMELMKTVDWESHWDEVWAVVHYENPQIQP